MEILVNPMTHDSVFVRAMLEACWERLDIIYVEAWRNQCRFVESFANREFPAENTPFYSTMIHAGRAMASLENALHTMGWTMPKSKM